MLSNKHGTPNCQQLYSQSFLSPIDSVMRIEKVLPNKISNNLILALFVGVTL